MGPLLVFTLTFGIFSSYGQILDPIEQLLDPTDDDVYQDYWEPNCVHLYENNEQTMCDEHLKLYIEKLQGKDFNLSSDNFWPIKSKNGWYELPILKSNVTKKLPRQKKKWIEYVSNFKTIFYSAVADATGKLPDGILKLDLQAYGNMPECLDIDVDGQNGLDPFK